MTRAPNRTLMDASFDKAALRCTVCGAQMGGCDCWTRRSSCGWLFRKGTKCRNSAHSGNAQPLEAISFGKGKQP